MTAEHDSTRGGARAEGPLEEVGAVPQRAAVGDRPRGLQRGRQRLGLLQPRPGPLPRLPLGRGRPGRHLRRPAAALLRAGPVERQGPDPQGAAVRPDQQRGQPRRGRQGVLLLPRQHADALVHEVPLQVPAGGVPVRRPRRDQPAPGPRRVRVRAARHRRLRRGPLLRRVRRVRQGSRPRTSWSRSASTTAARRRPSCTSCRRSGSATSGRGTAAPTGRRCSRSPARRRGASSRRVDAELGRALPLLRGGRAAAVHRERDQHAADLRRPEPQPVRQGRHQQLRRPRPGRGGEPGEDGDEGRRPTTASRSAPASAGWSGCGSRDVAPDGLRPAQRRRRQPVRRAASTRCCEARRKEADEFYAAVIPPSLDADEANVMRQALAGMLWSKQFYHYDVDKWLEERGSDPFKATRKAGAAQRPLAPHVQRRRHLDAGQVGVSLVRGLGPRLPRPRPDARRSGLRQAAAQADAARAVHAPQWPDPGLRVELRRRQPAGPRLGHHLHLPPGEGAEGRGRQGVAQEQLPEAAAELHLVGQPQGPHRAERLRGRLPGAGQHRRVRPQRAAADRRLPGAGRRHRLDGAVLPEHARDRRRAGDDRPGLRGHGAQVRRALPVDRLGDGAPGRGHGDVGRGGRLLLRRAPAARRPGPAAQGPVDGRPAAAVRGHGLRRASCWRSTRSSASGSQWFLDARPELCAAIHDPRKPGVAGRRLASILDETKLRRVLAKMLDENEFLSPYGIRSLSRYHADHPYVIHAGGQEYRVAYLPAESDTGMFGGNSNWRGPIWMPVNAPDHPGAAAVLHATTATTSPSNARPAPAGR